MTVLPLSYLNSLTSLSYSPPLLIQSPLSHSLPGGGGRQVGSRRAARGRAAAGERQGEGARGSPRGADLGVGLQGEGGTGPLAALGRAALCGDLLQSVAATLAEAADLAGRCRGPPPGGKLRTQSAIDALFGKLDLNLWDCALLVRTGMLSDASGPSPPAEAPAHADVRELLARLQIGHTEAKNRAVDGLLEALRSDEKSVLSVLGRANVSAMVQLLTASAPVVREKAATVICQVAESGSCEGLLVSEGVLPPLIRLAESGSLVGREKAAITLQRLSAASPDAARAVVGHGGAGPLIALIFYA